MPIPIIRAVFELENHNMEDALETIIGDDILDEDIDNMALEYVERWERVYIGCFLC